MGRAGLAHRAQSQTGLIKAALISQEPRRATSSGSRGGATTSGSRMGTSSGSRTGTADPGGGATSKSRTGTGGSRTGTDGPRTSTGRSRTSGSRTTTHGSRTGTHRSSAEPPTDPGWAPGVQDHHPRTEPPAERAPPAVDPETRASGGHNAAPAHLGEEGKWDIPSTSGIAPPRPRSAPVKGRAPSIESWIRPGLAGQARPPFPLERFFTFVTKNSKFPVPTNVILSGDIPPRIVRSSEPIPISPKIMILSRFTLGVVACSYAWTGPRRDATCVIGRDDATCVIGRDDATCLIGRDDATCVIGRDDATCLIGRDDATCLIGRDDATQLPEKRQRVRLKGFHTGRRTVVVCVDITNYTIGFIIKF